MLMNRKQQRNYTVSAGKHLSEREANRSKDAYTAVASALAELTRRLVI